MLRLQSLTALCLRTALAKRVPAITSTSTYRPYSKDNDSDSDDEKSHKKSKKPKAADKKQQQQPQQEKPAVAAASVSGEEESAATRLNKLLASMQTDDKLSLGRNVPKIAKPGEANKKRKEAVKHEAASKDIFAAAKNVAAMLNGDNAGEETKKQTESELLAKLLGHKPEGEAAGSAQQTEQAEELSLSDLIVGMKIDRRQQPKVQTRADYVRRSLNGKPQQQQQQQHYDNIAPNRRMRKQQPREAESYTGSVNLFGGEPLGIFKDTTQLKESTDILSTWQHLQNVELQLQVTHPPANYYEKIALWTEQGKVWRFPIDNEQDYAEERDVDFSEHIFLEQHLEDWCPSKGPIRHFMELVCVGLSKNPYITAKDKKEHILWYRDYFMAKRDILKDLIDKEKMDKISKNTASSQLEA